MMKSIFAGLLLIMVTGTLSGCQLPAAIGAMAQNAEYQKKIEVLAKYDGLQDKAIAVLVDADLSVRYEYPTLVTTVAEGLTRSIGTNVPGAKMLPANIGLLWQYQHPDWLNMPYGEVTSMKVNGKILTVDRVVYVDIYEYRLHPPGNRYEWDGVLAANVNIIEREAIDPDVFAESFSVTRRFPDKSGYGPETMGLNVVETSLINKFIIGTAWLFYDHVEPKYPDKYKPELESPN